MKTKKISVLILLALWAALTGFAWFGPVKESSDAERRPLAQMPEVTLESILGDSFMKDFESFSLDQFPLRDSFRTLKALFHTNVLGQKDNNDIYISQGYAAKQEYPLSQDSISHALNRFQYVYDKYLTESDNYMAIVPDKGQYLAESSGNLSLSYQEMFDAFQTGMPWATHVNLLDSLGVEDYYRTDTHWRQERLFGVAQTICDAMGIPAPKAENYTSVAVERPFYGVYYGQAALPMEPDTLYYLDSPMLQDCTVYDFESNSYSAVHNLDKLQSRDLYDIFLSGSRSLLTIENPNASSDKELIVFRDSFGSSIVPLLLENYKTVTVIDIRYIMPDLLDRFVEFQGQDVLMLYSTLVLNNSETIR